MTDHQRMDVSLGSDLLAALDVADEAWERLRARGREIHFEIAGMHRIRAEMRDLEGNVVRELTPSEVLTYAAGQDPELLTRDALDFVPSDEYAAAPTVMELAFAVSTDADAPAAARGRLVALRDVLDRDVLNDLMLVVSELVTDKVRHAAHGPVGVQVRARGPRDVTGEVVDPDGTGGPVAPTGSLDGGWGLQLVDALASRWGVHAGSTHVWFEILR